MKRILLITFFVLSSNVFAAVVQPFSGASAVLIPAAGSAPGANGTFFRSDITIMNLAAHDELVALQWLPQGTTGNGAPPIVITVRASSGLRSADFVHDYLKTSGIGSIIVSGVTSNGAPDPTAMLYVSSRIWTPQPGTTGTTSQSFDAIPMNAINALGPALGAALFGTGSIGDHLAFRVNVGLVNVDPANTQLFNINIDNGIAWWPPPPIGVAVPPMSMQQIPLGNGFASPGVQISIANMTPTATRSNLWTAYASTIDNTTGDAWSELAVPLGTSVTPLPTDHWAGGGMCVDTKDTQTNVAYMCATGTFGPLVSSNGFVEADGTWTTSVGPGSGTVPAHLSGRRDGYSLTVVIRTPDYTFDSITLQVGATTPCGAVCP